MSGEFEDREKGLGELNEERLRENGDIRHFSDIGTFSPPRVYDQPAQGNPGSIPVKYKVASTYDTRPVNSVEFWVSTDDTVSVTSNSRVSLEWTVPEGYIAVIRGIRWQHFHFGPYAPSNTIAHMDNVGATAAAVYMQILINGGIQPAFSQNGIDSPQGWGSDWQETHVIAGSGELIQVATNTTFEDVFTRAHSEIRGQLLLSRGYSKQFEIANIDETGTRPGSNLITGSEVKRRGRF